MYKKIIRTTKEAILKNNKETNFNFELHDFILRTRMIISLFIIIENNILHLEERKKKNCRVYVWELFRVIDFI